MCIPLYVGVRDERVGKHGRVKSLVFRDHDMVHDRGVSRGPDHSLLHDYGGTRVGYS